MRTAVVCVALCWAALASAANSSYSAIERGRYLAAAGDCELQCIPQGTLALLIDALGRGADSLVSATGVGGVTAGLPVGSSAVGAADIAVTGVVPWTGSLGVAGRALGIRLRGTVISSICEVRRSHAAPTASSTTRMNGRAESGSVDPGRLRSGGRRR